MRPEMLQGVSVNIQPACVDERGNFLPPGSFKPRLSFSELALFDDGQATPSAAS